MPFCICLPNFVQNGPSATQLWRHIHFPRWPPWHRNSTSGFVFCEFAHLGRSKSTPTEKSKSTEKHFVEIFLSTAEILLLPVSVNKRPSCWNSTCGFEFHVCVTIGMSFCICLPNFLQIGPSASYHAYISIFKMAAVSHIEFSQGNCRPPTTCKWGSQLGPQIYSDL